MAAGIVAQLTHTTDSLPRCCSRVSARSRMNLQEPLDDRREHNDRFLLQRFNYHNERDDLFIAFSSRRRPPSRERLRSLVSQMKQIRHLL